MKKINTRVWLMMLTLLFGTMSVFAGGKKTYYSKAIAHAVGEGTVYVDGASGSAGATSEKKQSSEVDKNASAPTHSYTFKAYPKTADNYKCLGWFTSSSNGKKSGNAEYTENGLSTNDNENSPQTHDRYAIFYKFHPYVMAIEFGDVAYNSSSQTQTVVVAYDNVDAAKSQSGVSGVLSAALTDNTTQKVCSVAVTINPTTPGEVNQTLTISAQKAGQNINLSIPVTANVTATPSYTWNTDVWNANGTMKRDVYVGETLTNVVTTPSSGTKTYTIENWTPTGNNNTGATKPTFTDNTLYCTQAGTLTLRIAQAAETNGFEAGGSTIDITINKRPNTIKIKGVANYSNSIYVDSYDNGLTLTADNTDYTNCPITNTQTAGKDIATFYQNDKVVYSSYKLGTATWTLSQPENYKYVAGSGSFTVKVIQQPVEECYILNEPTEHSMGKYGDSSFPTAGNASYTYSWSGRGAVLSFKMWKYSNANDIGNHVYIYDANGNEISADSKDYSISSMSTTEQEYTINLSENARSVKFQNGGGTWSSASSLNTYVKDVKVTRKTWLNIATDSGNNGTLTINKKSDGSAINPGQTGVADSKIYWSCAGGGDLKIVCENQHFSFSQNKITNTACNNGTTDITVSYTNTEPGTETATVTVYNKMYRQTFTVKGVIEKADQLITWNNDILRLDQSYNNVATANTLVTYESEDESIIRVDEDDEGHKTILTAVGTGTVNITATAEESSFYAEKSDTKSIKVTEKQIQWIDWNQSLFGLKLGGANVTMNAVAASDVEGCVSSRLIEYSSSNESVVKVVNNNQLQIIGVGTAIITAVQAGGFDTDGHDYERAETEKTVIVRDPNAPCESFAYQQGQEVKMDCGWNALNKQTKTSEINFNGIIPATGTLRYKGEYRKVAINYFDGTMTVEQYIPGENWQPVTGGDLSKPSIGTYKTANLTFDRRATKMRVKVTDGLGYHYFTDCQVTQARFIETTAPVDFNLNVGQQQNQVIYLSYSNITDGLSLTLAQGANSHFSVDKSFIEGSCGSAAKNVALTITYHPTTEETNAQDVLTITDGTTSCQVVLTGSATRVNRHINWDHADETDIYTVQTETLSAEARTNLNDSAGVVTFSLASSSTATGAISMENVLSFTSAGVANVVAYTTDDARFNAAPNVTKVFNVSKTPTTISTLPVLEAVTSGTAVEDVELTGWQVTNTVNGGVVEGKLAITSADLINVGTNTVTLSFTPSNTDMYVGCTGTTTIVVNKATSVATPSAANIVYGQKVKESELSNEGTEGKWAWNTGNNEAVLDAGTHEGLAVHFTPTSGNYTELDATVSLTVEKADPEVTAQATAITYGQPISASKLSTASGEVSGTWDWAVDEEQVLSVGNHVLKANFTSTNANYNDLSNVDVTLKVKKIEKLEVEVPLSFCAGGEVTFHDNTYAEAGEYQIEAEGATRDTVYNVTVTKLQPTTGTDSKTITVGANESWNGNDLSGYTIGSHEVVFHTENVAGCDSTVTLSLTVVPATNVFTNEAGDGDWENPANWESGIVPTSDPDIIVTGALEINDSITVGSLTIESTGSVAVISGGTLTVNGTSEYREAGYGDIHVLNDGAIDLGETARLEVRNFTLDAKLGDKNTPAASGQVSGDEKLMVNGDAYFDMAFDPSEKISFGWYDFVVPFEVEVVGGISRINSDDDRVLISGVDFLIQEYSEARRASNLKSWSNFSGTLQPGRVYTITFNYRANFDQNEFRFKKKANAAIGASDTFRAVYTESGSGSNYDKGWNGLGNGMLKHAQLHGIEDNDVKVQIYNHATNTYVGRQANNVTFAVGTSFFIQVEAEQNIKMDTAHATPQKPLLAPSRTGRSVDEFHLSMMDEDASEVMDNLWVSASEDATGEYVIGHDLLKMGTPTSAKVAQMWTENNGLKLCDIEMPLINDNANCALGLFAPKAGNYWFAIDEAPEDATLYLTHNGNIIWDLTISPYLFDLSQGTTEGYGLRIEVKKTPAIMTGVEQSEFSDQSSVRKVIIDNKVYVVTPEGKMYDIVGKGIKF